MSDRHIVAFGGGGFSDGRGVTPLDRYALSLIGRPRPRVCFVPTASGDAAPYIERFYAAFTRLECEPSHLSLFQPPYPSLPGYLASKDLIYVGAEHGQHVGRVAAAWFRPCSAKRVGGRRRALRGLRRVDVLVRGRDHRFLRGFERSQMDSVFFPKQLFTLRRGGTATRDSIEAMDGDLAGGYGADDGIGLHFVETEFVEAVAERDAVAAYRVEARDGSIESRNRTRLLEADDARPVTGDDQ